MKLSKLCTLMLPLGLISSGMAAEQITLEDGRKILLNDDFTWQYLPATESQPAQPRTESVAIPVNPDPISSGSSATETAITTTAFEIGQKNNIIQLDQFGVEVVLGSPSWQDGELLIPTKVINQGLKPVIEIDLMVQIFDNNGQLLAQQQLPVWRSIKRMAETYLRPKQRKDGNELLIEVAQRSGYQLQATIAQIDYR